MGWGGGVGGASISIKGCVWGGGGKPAGGGDLSGDFILASALKPARGGKKGPRAGSYDTAAVRALVTAVPTGQRQSRQKGDSGA